MIKIESGMENIYGCSLSEHVDLGRERERDVECKGLGFHASFFLLSEVEPSSVGKTCVWKNLTILEAK